MTGPSRHSGAPDWRQMFADLDIVVKNWRSERGMALKGPGYWIVKKPDQFATITFLKNP